MKSLFSFIRATMVGGIFFLLPIYLIFSLLYKAQLAAAKIMAPLAHFLPENILGMNAGRLLAAFGLVLLCFLAGMLFRVRFIKRGIHYLEDRVLSHLPGYSLLKSKTNETFGEKVEYYQSTVLVEDQQAWKMGLLVEEVNGLSTIYFPKPPKNETGEIVTISSSRVKKLDLPTNEAFAVMKNFGKGTIQHINKN